MKKNENDALLRNELQYQRRNDELGGCLTDCPDLQVPHANPYRHTQTRGRSIGLRVPAEVRYKVVQSDWIRGPDPFRLIALDDAVQALNEVCSVYPIHFLFPRCREAMFIHTVGSFHQTNCLSLICGRLAQARFKPSRD